MHKIGLIIKREYLTRVRRRTFLIATFLTPVSIALLMGIPIWLGGLSSVEQEIVILDEANLFNGRIPDLEGAKASESVYFTFDQSSLPVLKETFEASGYDGILHIPPFNIQQPGGFAYYAPEQIGIKTKIYLQARIERAIENKRIEAAGLDKSVLKRLKVQVNIRDKILDDEGEKQGNALMAAAIGGVMGFSIYIVLFIYGTMLMRGVIEEKTNRIVEVIVSSVKPYQMMIGKIVGIGAVGLTQFMIWIVLIFILRIFFGLIFGIPFSDAADLSQLNQNEELTEEQVEMITAVVENFGRINFVKIISWFIFYFLGGYLLYAALFAAIGSAANDDADNIQSLTFPITIPIVISIFIMFTTIEQPNSDLAFWASIIPLSSPIVMPARIAYDVDNWQIILSAICLVLGFTGTIWFAARIYRTGILMYGKKITFRELSKWLFYKN